MAIPILPQFSFKWSPTREMALVTSRPRVQGQWIDKETETNYIVQIQENDKNVFRLWFRNGLDQSNSGGLFASLQDARNHAYATVQHDSHKQRLDIYHKEQVFAREHEMVDQLTKLGGTS